MLEDKELEYLNSSSLSSNFSFSENKNNHEDNCSSNFSTKLRSWIIEEQISRKTGNALLKIFRNCGHESLPKDIRTLVRTQRKASQYIMEMDNVFMYILDFLQHSLERYFKECPDSIKLLINCDGMSLTKSSGSKFWPILMSIYTNIRIEPFSVGVYHGRSKPKNANTYLTSFIDEIISILKNGVLYKGRTCKISIAGIDAPARAFITCTKSHFGYFSCHKCIQEGDHIKSCFSRIKMYIEN